jgi:hypothetical protein
VVTARNTDIGDLINAGQTPGSALFRVADMEKLRVYVDVPEPYASQTKPGINVYLRFTEHPGKQFPANLVRTAQALDPIQRTLRVEVQVDNHNGELFPGAFAEVHFKLPGSTTTYRIAANTILFRTEGLQVATVGQDNKARLKSIVEGRDFGTTIEVLSGIEANDRVIVNPPDSLSTGGQVRIAPPPKQGEQGKQAGEAGQGQGKQANAGSAGSGQGQQGNGGSGSSDHGDKNNTNPEAPEKGEQVSSGPVAPEAGAEGDADRDSSTSPQSKQDP